MKFSTFMSIVAVVSFLFGVSFLLAPVQTMSMYGTVLDVSGQYIARYLGSAFLGLAVIAWMAKNGNPKEGSTKGFVLGGFILTLTGFIASVFDALYGVGNSLVWSTVAIYFLLALGFGFYQFGKSNS
jgi:hypothetical protein